MPYHLFLPWSTGLAFIGLGLCLVLFLLYLERRDLLGVAAVFLAGYILFRNQQGLVNLMGTTLVWVQSFLLANNKYGFVFTNLVFVLAPWAYLIARWPREERAQARRRRR